MTDYTTFYADGVDHLLTIAFDGSTGATTMIGGTVKCYMVKSSIVPTASPAVVTGIGTIIDATHVESKFTGGSVPPGIYELQVICTPSGYGPQTYSSTWTVKTSGGPA